MIGGGHDLEREILAIPLVYGNEFLADVLNYLEPSLLASEQHREILQVYHEIRDAGGEVDLPRVVALKPSLREYLTTMIGNSQGTPTSTLDYVGDLRELRAREKVQLLAQRMAAGDDLGKELTEAIREAETARSIDVLDGAALVKAAMTPTEVDVRAGFGSLDELLDGGFEGGQFILIAASTSSGKTAMALALAINAAVFRKRRVCFFSLEMTGREMGRRALSFISRIAHWRFKRPKAIPLEIRPSVQAAVKRLEDSELQVVDRGKVAVEDVVKVCRAGVPPEMVIVDYLQLMQSKGRHESNNVRVASISRDLKLAARELNVPFVVLSQLRRIENRRPRIDDLRDSGSLEQDADIVILLHRENRDSTEVLVDVAKNRHGRTGETWFDWTGEQMRFSDRGGNEYDDEEMEL